METPFRGHESICSKQDSLVWSWKHSALAEIVRLLLLPPVVIGWGYRNGAVRLCVCICLPISALTAELFDVLSRYLVQGLTLMISWMSLMVKAILSVMYVCKCVNPSSQKDFRAKRVHEGSTGGRWTLRRFHWRDISIYKCFHEPLNTKSRLWPLTFEKCTYDIC